MDRSNPAQIVLAGASDYYHVALIIMIGAGEGLDQLISHLAGADADGIVLVRAVQGDVDYLGILGIMFVLDPFEIGGVSISGQITCCSVVFSIAIVLFSFIYYF